MKLSNVDEQRALLRLTALWGLNETALGGVLHLFRSPFTGLFVGGLAIILISLIAYFSSSPFKSIMKALMVVLIIKFTLSPHSPITAYVAVSFQALAGGIFFSVLPYRLAALVFAVVAMLESVFQKLLVFTLLFGKPLWESLDIFVEQVVSRLGYEGMVGRGSVLLVGGYALLYGLAGLGVGAYVGGLPRRLERVIPDLNLDDEESLGKSNEESVKRSFWKSKRFRMLLFLLVVSALIFIFLPQAGGSKNPFFIFFRATAVLVLWFVIVSPVLRFFLKKFIARQQTNYQSELKTSLELLPVFRTLLSRAWRELSGVSGFRKIDKWVVRSLGYCLVYGEDRGE